MLFLSSWKNSCQVLLHVSPFYAKKEKKIFAFFVTRPDIPFPDNLYNILYMTYFKTWRLWYFVKYRRQVMMALFSSKKFLVWHLSGWGQASKSHHHPFLFLTSGKKKVYSFLLLLLLLLRAGQSRKSTRYGHISIRGCIPNQQRTLNKLPTELWRRNFVYMRQLSIQIGVKHAKTCLRRVRVTTELPFCMPPLVVGHLLFGN